ncbi:MAG: thioredoxin [Microgenomates group bacterium]
MLTVTGTKTNFDSEVLKFKGKVIVDFWAAWCGPCLMLAPVLEEIAADYPDIKLVKVDVDSEGSLATQYNVTSIPNVVIFDHGQVVSSIVGFHQKQDYLNKLK